jgi:hypothetical protein
MKPLDYRKLSKQQRADVRERYEDEQGGDCFYCHAPLYEDPPKVILDAPVNMALFPPGFLNHPIHLQHSHLTGMTEGAVHAYCNAVMWQYEGG